MDQDLNLDPTLQGENTETPSASPAGMITAGDGDLVNQQGAENLSPEEVSWNDLKGPTQERIKQLLKERNERAAEAEYFKNLAKQTPQDGYNGQPSYSPPAPAPQVAEAVRKLSEVGIATKDEVREEVNRTVGSLIYQIELDKLSNKYDGSTGLPKFDKDEYEDYIQRHPQYRNYTPEDVYQKMYSDEIFDWKVQNQGRPSDQKPSTPTLRPTRTQVREEPLTVEMIESRMREPDGVQWYERNKDRINAVVAKTQASE